MEEDEARPEKGNRETRRDAPIAKSCAGQLIPHISLPFLASGRFSAFCTQSSSLASVFALTTVSSPSFLDFLVSSEFIVRPAVRLKQRGMKLRGDSRALNNTLISTQKVSLGLQ